MARQTKVSLLTAIYMPDTYEGTAKEAFEQLTETRNRAAADLASADQDVYKRQSVTISKEIKVCSVSLTWLYHSIFAHSHCMGIIQH